MTYTRVLVFETPLSRTEIMKNTCIAEVILRKPKKEILLNGYNIDWSRRPLGIDYQLQ